MNLVWTITSLGYGIRRPRTVVSGLSQPFRGAYSVRTADVAAAQLLTLIDQLTPAGSGHFFAYDGERLPW